MTVFAHKTSKHSGLYTKTGSFSSFTTVCRLSLTAMQLNTTKVKLIIFLFCITIVAGEYCVTAMKITSIVNWLLKDHHTATTFWWIEKKNQCYYIYAKLIFNLNSRQFILGLKKTNSNTIATLSQQLCNTKSTPVTPQHNLRLTENVGSSFIADWRSLSDRNLSGPKSTYNW